MAMTDEDFESVLNKLGLSQKNYSSADDSQLTAAPQQAPIASMPASGTPPEEAQFPGVADLRKSDDSIPAGYDGSKEANPNLPVPSMPEDTQPTEKIPSFNIPGALSSKVQQPSSSSVSTKQVTTNSTDSTNPELSDEALKRAQQQARDRSLITSLGEAGGTFASEANGKNFDPSFFREQQKLSDQPVQDIETRRNAMLTNTKVVDSILSNQLKGLSVKEQAQANDPNSSVSKTARGIIQMLHPGIENTPGFTDLGAKDLKDFTQHILESQDRLEAAKEARETSNTFKQSAMDARSQAQQAREDQQNQVMQDKISKEVNTLSQSSRNALGTAGRSLVSADRAKAVLDQPVVTPQDLASVSADISNIISGAATVSGTQHQEYNTLKQQADGLLQRLSSNPQDVAAPKLKEHLKDVIEGMRKISSETAKRNLKFVEVSHPAFAAKNPSYFEDVAKGLAEQTQPLVPEASQASTTAQQGSYGKDVLDYAKSHNITPEQANQIKLQRTSGAQ